jgi:hypothetical protein
VRLRLRLKLGLLLAACYPPLTLCLSAAPPPPPNPIPLRPQPLPTNTHHQVTGFYELLEAFDMSVPPEELAAAACLGADYASLRSTAWAAEAAKDRHAEAFRCGRRL